MQTHRTDDMQAFVTLILMIVLLIAVLMGAAALGVWWIETRFGANAAAMVLGGLGVVAVFLLGMFAAHRIQRRTVDQVVNVTEIMANGDAMRQRANIETLRIERVNAQAAARNEQMLMSTYQRGMQHGQRQIVDAAKAAPPRWESADQDDWQ